MNISAETPKVVIFGIDGGTFDLILPWVKEGKLPNLARLIREGVHGPLQSTIHPLTPMAWSTIMTGKNPGKHGVFDFVALNKDRYSVYLTNGGSRKCGTIWKIISDSGKKVGLVNMPYTYPPEKVNGFVISGYDARIISKKLAHPEGIFREITENVGKFPHWSIRKIRGQHMIEDIDYEVKNRTLVSKYLLKKCCPDLFAVVTMSADQAQHLFWKNRSFQNGDIKIDDVILYAYQKIDEAIGEFLKIVADDTKFMVISDHGGGEIKRFFSLNQWLHKVGLLHYKEAGSNSNTYSIPMNILRTAGSIVTQHIPFYLADNLLRGWLRQYMLLLRDKLGGHLMFSDIDWKKTKAFSWEPCGYGNIQINLKGRYPQGIVEAGKEYKEVCDTVIGQSKDIRDPESGEPIIESVYRREELYDGKFSMDGPDLIVVPQDYRYCTFEFMGSKTREVFPEKLLLKNVTVAGISGMHRTNGIFIARGKNLREGHEIEGARVEDIAPTILHLMDIPIPPDMDGRVLEEIFV